MEITLKRLNEIASALEVDPLDILLSEKPFIIYGLSDNQSGGNTAIFHHSKNVTEVYEILIKEKDARIATLEKYVLKLEEELDRLKK